MDNVYFLNGDAPVLNAHHANIHHPDGTITKVSIEELRKAVHKANQSTDEKDKHQSFSVFDGDNWYGLYRFSELDLD